MCSARTWWTWSDGTGELRGLPLFLLFFLRCFKRPLLPSTKIVDRAVLRMPDPLPSNENVIILLKWSRKMMLELHCLQIHLIFHIIAAASSSSRCLRRVSFASVFVFSLFHSPVIRSGCSISVPIHTIVCPCCELRSIDVVFCSAFLGCCHVLCAVQFIVPVSQFSLRPAAERRSAHMLACDLIESNRNENKLKRI